MKVKYRLLNDLLLYEDECITYLEKMAQDGWYLVKVGTTFFKFERRSPRKVKYQMDYNLLTPDYLEITEDQYVDFNRDQIMNKRMVGFNLYEDDILTPIDDKSQIEFTSSDTSIGNFASGIDELHTTSPTKAGPTIVTIENKANGYKAFVTVTVKGDTVWPSGSKVAVGKNFSIALKENGTLWTWG